ncbi:H-NS family nucleoid-associated regulatory protein [Variovorax sp. J22R24]|uniref:H-NS family nucleoid-associated regulatory protein n=1 Tax=Variovorax gracilis TaxID=3053502 RepID=UPI002577990F|nr:H-NS family nucleoid-associated regulatory protein [Variovorax sp. J22R24]MDM0103322.1 H-NS family nucleoid-associated regulatory protein [Variovorax sp. J22R24]
MTQSYSQLQKKIATLQRQADALREKEISGVISRIKVAIDHYGLTANQLGLGAAPSARKFATRNAASVKGAKYSDGNGNSWSGRGPRPHWLRDAMASGRSLDEFISGTPAAPAGKAKTRKFKRRPSSVLYRDGSGNSWTGRGPRPRWMKEALASGKTLEDLTG